MTGFGRYKSNYKDKTITIEIRSLNSKFTDIRLKLPQQYKEKEVDIRRIFTEETERGKIDFTLEIHSALGEGEFSLNKGLFRRYHQELLDLSEELRLPPGDLMQAILRMPNVVNTEAEELEEEEWKAVSDAIRECISNFNAFRAREGAVMEQDMRQRIAAIKQALTEIPPFEEDRVTRLRQRLYSNLEEYMGKENIDENRFEQEILFYLEKMDINEEKVRLGQHCDYYLEVLGQKHHQKGRKLSFISQEMGREINTLGAKAYSSDIQRLVVGMKEELEKIKEQVANTV